MKTLSILRTFYSDIIGWYFFRMLREEINIWVIGVMVVPNVDIDLIIVDVNKGNLLGGE